MNNGKAIAAYWEATFRGKLSESEVTVFERTLADVEVEDAVKSIDYVAAIGGYPPTPQRLAELSIPYRNERRQNELELEKRPQLQGANHPISFKEWLETKATLKEQYLVAKVSPQLREKYGLKLEDE